MSRCKLIRDKAQKKSHSELRNDSRDSSVFLSLRRDMRKRIEAVTFHRGSDVPFSDGMFTIFESRDKYTNEITRTLIPVK